MNHGRHDFTATLLPDGTVLVTAYEGSDTRRAVRPEHRYLERDRVDADVRLGTYTATLLPDGTVLVVGGVPNNHCARSSTTRGPGRGSQRRTSVNARQYHTATLLPNGTVLVAGGRGGTASAELYSPGLMP